ncbi:sigma-70 family RNA polymerase sigma factor [Nocardioides sp. W7]|uniref:sigma-70 family RNA polymerase sigma factor n=1 Tax=Nocardioides sp. W7 TaxID=2931390 RepID=UPI001FD224BD|nr:sigma-70 family RNA polymerase sigma factor [Nocardioides sp. W7]
MLSLLRPNQRRQGRQAGTTPPDPLPRSVERDQVLVAAARAGDAEAVDELYRLHLSVARGVARGLCRPDDLDDVVSEAFARVLKQISRGGGPQVSFRAYLITAVRSAAADLPRKNARLVLTDDVDEVTADTRLPDRARRDSAVRQESQLLADALGDLPARWQLVLWWTTVEQRPLSEVGQRLGINPNAAAALAFRARQGLRDAYVRLHLPAVADPSCAACRAEYVEALLARSDTPLPDDVVEHLRFCDPCRDVTDDLRDTRAGLASPA